VYSFIMLMAQQGGAEGGGSSLVTFLPFIAIFLIMYFLMIRPQAKKQKQRQQMLQAIQKGDDVITTGGVHGKIMGFKDENKTIIVKVDDNVKLSIDRSAINVVKKEGQV
jgi:preprotein translocase subunit YajC